MEKAVSIFTEATKGIILGGVTPALIDTFKIQYYGQDTQIKHLAVTSYEKGLILVKPHDISLLNSIRKHLEDNGFNAYLFSKQIVAVSVPPICGEERDKTIIRVKKLGEETKVAIRNIRKQFRKSSNVDDKTIQQITDNYIYLVDELVKNKCNQIRI